MRRLKEKMLDLLVCVAWTCNFGYSGENLPKRTNGQLGKMVPRSCKLCVQGVVNQFSDLGIYLDVQNVTFFRWACTIVLQIGFDRR